MFMDNEGSRKYGPRASFTIEAAMVVPIAFIAIVLLIKWDIYAHDTVFSYLAANEAAELYGHLPENSDIAEVSSHADSVLGLLFSGRHYSLDIEADGNGSIVSVSGSEGRRVFEDEGFRPEEMMRSLTILEEVTHGN